LLSHLDRSAKRHLEREVILAPSVVPVTLGRDRTGWSGFFANVWNNLDILDLLPEEKRYGLICFRNQDPLPFKVPGYDDPLRASWALAQQWFRGESCPLWRDRLAAPSQAVAPLGMIDV
jgi:hypothetical protein